MKKTVSVLLIAVFILLICFWAQAGERSAEAATPAASPGPAPGILTVDVYAGMQNHLGIPLYTFKESEQIKVFKDAVGHAKALPGLADMPPSDYTAVLHYKDNYKRMYIWASEVSASLMYENEAGTLYKVDYDYAVKLYKLLLTGGEPEDFASLEAENDIVSVKVFGAGRNGPPLYTFTDASDTALFYSAMKHASKLEGLFSMMSPDYRLTVTDSSGSRDVALWLSESGASFQYRDHSHELYRVRDDDALKLRALFDEHITPTEELIELETTGDIDLILKYPAPDMAAEPLNEGLGCWTAESRSALFSLLSSADGRVEFMLPSDESLTLQKAVLRSCSDISAYYHDEATGNEIMYSAIKGNRDFYPWDMGWKKTKINGYTCYKLVLERNGGKVTLVYLQHDGWTVIEQITGNASKADLKRCLELKTYSWNDGEPLLEPGSLLIEGNENIERALSAAGDAAFEQHRNSYYERVHTSSLQNLERFLSERLGFKEYYYYDGNEEGLPLDSVNVEYDGERVTFLLGDVKGDEYKSFSYTTGGCPSLYGEVNITALPKEIKDFGRVTLGGVTYYYSVRQNYKKYITTIAWEQGGVNFSVTTRTSEMQPVNAGVISDWISHVSCVPLG